MTRKSVAWAGLMVLCALVGGLLGYVGGFFVGAAVATRSYPPGGGNGAGLAAVLLGLSAAGMGTVAGASLGAAAPFVVRRLRARRQAR